MPAVSKKQQRFMGMVHATQKGEMKAPSKSVADAAKSMSKSDAKDFAETKHEGLPEKKTEKAAQGIPTNGKMLADMGRVGTMTGAGSILGSLLGAGAAAGGTIGGLHGIVNPGQDEEGQQRSRIAQAIRQALIGSGLGAAGGLAAGAGGLLGGGVGGAAGYYGSGGQQLQRDLGLRRAKYGSYRELGGQLSPRITHQPTTSAQEKQSMDDKQAMGCGGGKKKKKKKASAADQLQEYLSHLSQANQGSPVHIKAAREARIIKLSAEMASSGNLWDSLGKVYPEYDAEQRFKLAQQLAKGMIQHFGKKAMGLAGCGTAGTSSLGSGMKMAPSGSETMPVRMGQV